MGINCLLLFLGKTTFSPTRHTVYHLFILLIGIAFGLQGLFNTINMRWLPVASLGFVVGLSLVSLAKFDGFLTPRIDPLSTPLLDKIVSKEKVDFVVGDLPDLRFFKSVQGRFFYITDRIYCDFVPRDQLVPGRTRRILFYSRGVHSNKTLKTRIEDYMERASLACETAPLRVTVSNFRTVYSRQGAELSPRIEYSDNDLALYTADVLAEVKNSPSQNEN